jgi:hypothetical protein
MNVNRSQSPKYVKPEILSISNAKSIIQSSENAKLSPFYDGTEATGPAYEADE